MRKDNSLPMARKVVVWPISDIPELALTLIGDCKWEPRSLEPYIAALGLKGLEETFSLHPPGPEVIKLYDIDFS